MPARAHHSVIVHVPDEWTTTEKGDFFEDLVAELLRPMRFEVKERLRFTGMEIDLLAVGKDEPRQILVECKALADALASPAISKLLGNVEIRDADAGWLFSTSDLTKDGRGLAHKIDQDARLASRFVLVSTREDRRNPNWSGCRRGASPTRGSPVWRRHRDTESSARTPCTGETDTPRGFPSPLFRKPCDSELVNVSRPGMRAVSFLLASAGRAVNEAPHGSLEGLSSPRESRRWHDPGAAPLEP